MLAELHVKLVTTVTEGRWSVHIVRKDITVLRPPKDPSVATRVTTVVPSLLTARYARRVSNACTRKVKTRMIVREP